MIEGDKTLTFLLLIYDFKCLLRWLSKPGGALGSLRQIPKTTRYEPSPDHMPAYEQE